MKKDDYALTKSQTTCGRIVAKTCVSSRKKKDHSFPK